METHLDKNIQTLFRKSHESVRLHYSHCELNSSTFTYKPILVNYERIHAHVIRIIPLILNERLRMLK
jgi:hypothetical protein